MTENMTIWKAVEKTDPRHTKKVTFGRKFTAIDAHYQIMRATEQFGPVGMGWGYECTNGTIKLDDDTMMATCDVYIWHGKRVNGYGPFRGMSELRWLDKTGKVKFDTDAAKKAMTDALTKGLSHLGFSADVFLGLYDDNKYVQALEKEASREEEELRERIWCDKVVLGVKDKAKTQENVDAMMETVAAKVAQLPPDLFKYLMREIDTIKEGLTNGK